MRLVIAVPGRDLSVIIERHFQMAGLFLEMVKGPLLVGWPVFCPILDDQWKLWLIIFCVEVRLADRVYAIHGFRVKMKKAHP